MLMHAVSHVRSLCKPWQLVLHVKMLRAIHASPDVFSKESIAYQMSVNALQPNDTSV